jgi:hypothetical protein
MNGGAAHTPFWMNLFCMASKSNPLEQQDRDMTLKQISKCHNHQIF